jgi:hypothetical protein
MSLHVFTVKFLVLPKYIYCLEQFKQYKEILEIKLFQR